jgi:hypothetical protein
MEVDMNAEENQDIEIEASGGGLSLKAKGAGLFIILSFCVIGISLIGISINSDDGFNGKVALIFLAILSYRILSLLTAMFGFIEKE